MKACKREVVGLATERTMAQEACSRSSRGQWRRFLQGNPILEFAYDGRDVLGPVQFVSDGDV